MIKKCEECSKIIAAKGRAKFCSPRCKARFNSRKAYRNNYKSITEFKNLARPARGR